MPPDLVALIRGLVRTGHVVAIRGVFTDSYYAEVRNAMGAVVGNLEYRSPRDELEDRARGLSYASVFDAQRYPDRTFELVCANLRSPPPMRER